ncbi:MAG: hypothetical protein EA387_03410 [Nitriliruptor sp.]|nr:MAG: hypothetical protein EA387_03410 [Nitriliruptor sp.]
MLFLLLVGALMSSGCSSETIDEEAYRDLEIWSGSVAALMGQVVEDLDTVMNDPEAPDFLASAHLGNMQGYIEGRNDMASGRQVRSWTIERPNSEGTRTVSGAEFEAVLEGLYASLETILDVAQRVQDPQLRNDPSLREALDEATRQVAESRGQYRSVMFGDEAAGG